MQRNIFILASAVLVAVVAGLLFILANSGNSLSAPAATNQPSAVAVPFERLAQGKQSVIAKRVNYFITSADQLVELWKTIKATSTPPTIDFNKKEVIAVFAGEAPNSSIAVANIKDTDVRTVSIVIARPDAACKKVSMTTPYEVVAVPFTSLPFVHADIAETTSCTK